MNAMTEAERLTVACMCGAASHTFSVPAASLPLPTHLCSCDISRRISGSLLTSYVNICHGLDSSKPDVSALTLYPSSDVLTRYFCSTCGTHMYLEYKHDGHFEAATGTLQVDSTDRIVEYKAHMWIGDTRDGGASQFIPRINGKQLERYLEEAGKSDRVPLDWSCKTIGTELIDQSPIHAHCHCKGVEYYIHPPNAASRNAKSPYPDLIVPYHSGSSANPENGPWWVADSDRYLAGTCACTSCRQASGFDITFWAFVPAVNITRDAKGQQAFGKIHDWPKIKVYRSSSRVTRAFCATCGANVFWIGDERPSLIDVAVGLLDARSGARSEEILAWWPERVSFREEALNNGLIEGLEDGLRSRARVNDSGFVSK